MRRCQEECHTGRDNPPIFINPALSKEYTLAKANAHLAEAEVSLGKAKIVMRLSYQRINQASSPLQAELLRKDQ
jgi:hypothetical protein